MVEPRGVLTVAPNVIITPRRVLDCLDVLGYRVIDEKATNYAHLKQALKEQFPVVRNRSEIEVRFYALYQNHNQRPSDFVYELLQIHKQLNLDMVGEILLDHVTSRLKPQLLDYVEEKHPQKTSSLLQIIDKYEEGDREENWRDARGNNRYSVNSGPQRESNRFGGQGVGDNRRFDSRRRCGQSDHRFNNQGGRQGGSMNSAFKSQNGQDFDKKSLVIPDDQIKQLPIVEKPVEIDLSNAKVGSSSVKQSINDNHIGKMLQEGTIWPIQSPYASPVVLTRTNNGLLPDSSEAYRFAIGYRKLNEITKYPRYPLPLIDDLITNIPNTAMMSSLDLKSDYFQLAINSRDIEKTAFITRNGTFAFLRMSFGRSGEAPNFLKAIDIILKPVLGPFVSCYMDDVIITSLSFNEHIDHLNQVFALMRDAGLTLNKDKCHFARDKLKYLELIISKNGIKTGNNKVKVITEFKIPKYNKEV
ncbi:retrovirus-related Pol polyprotein from transposon 297 [Trichonephila clavipes]|nr:retrovirus-related Pol polyprotein from transposon 297 [Trichonephila clavipes]